MTEDQPNADTVIWLQVFFPPLREAAALALLRHWAAQRHAPLLIIETRSTKDGVQYLIGCRLRHRAAVRRGIEELIRGSVVTGYPADERDQMTTARRLSLTTTRRSFVPVDASASARSILLALTAVKHTEGLVLQVILAQRRSPSLPPPEIPADQSAMSTLLHGVRPDRRSDARSALIAKLGQHGFAATVRIGVTAASPERRRSLLMGLASALGTNDAPGARLAIRPANPKAVHNAQSTAWWRGAAQTWNVAEISHVLGWPITDSDDPLPGQPPRHPRPLRPAEYASEGDRVVALATAPGANGNLGYSVTDATRHSWILGPNGVGKSNLLLEMIRQDLEAGRPIVVIEPKDLVTDILSRIPPERRDDVVVLDPLDRCPVGVNGLAHHPGQRPQLIADANFAMFQALHGDNLGPRSSDILRNALEVLARRDDASLVMLPVLLTNPGFRRSVTQGVMRDDPFAAGPFWEWFESLSPDAASRITSPLSNKIRPLLSPTLRGVLAQRSPRFNIRQVLTEKKVLLVPLQAGVLGPEAAQLFAAVVIGELWQAIRERVSVPENERDPVMVYIDEVQDYLKLPTDLADALATARSLRAGFHLAHQFRGQLPPSMLAAVEANARSRIVFQLGATDARAMAQGQSLLKPEDFSALGKYQIYAQLMRDNTVQPWASGVTAPPPPETSDPEDIRARSRARYGQPIEEIEAGFAALLQTPANEPARNRRRRQVPAEGIAASTADTSDGANDDRNERGERL